MITTLNWLKNKLIKRENGIILDKSDSDSFDAIQNFINNKDRPFQTPVIYYEAFPEESAVDFLQTLKVELTSKLNKPELESLEMLGQIIEAAELQMIIIDRCYLQPLDTLKHLLKLFDSYNVAIILVGSQAKMAIAQILNLPTVSQWDKLVVDNEFHNKTTPKSNWQN